MLSSLTGMPQLISLLAFSQITTLARASLWFIHSQGTLHANSLHLELEHIKTSFLIVLF